MRLGRLGCTFDVSQRHAADTVGDVFRDAGVGEEGVLRDIADRATQVLEIERAYRLAVDANFAVLRFVKAQQQLGQRTFSAAGTADEGDVGAGGNVQVDAVERCRAAPIVREADTIEFQFAAHPLYRKGFAFIRYRHRRLQQVHHALDRCHRALKQVAHIGQARQRPQQALRQVHECRIAAHTEFTAQRQEAAIQQCHGEASQNGDADHRRDCG